MNFWLFLDQNNTNNLLILKRKLVKIKNRINLFQYRIWLINISFNNKKNLIKQSLSKKNIFKSNKCFFLNKMRFRILIFK
jgi:hypothetical protein